MCLTYNSWYKSTTVDTKQNAETLVSNIRYGTISLNKLRYVPSPSNTISVILQLSCPIKDNTGRVLRTGVRTYSAPISGIIRPHWSHITVWVPEKIERSLRLSIKLHSVLVVGRHWSPGPPEMDENRSK